jgi:hypothetical protein
MSLRDARIYVRDSVDGDEAPVTRCHALGVPKRRATENGHPNQQINRDLTETGHGGSISPPPTAPQIAALRQNATEFFRTARDLGS